MASPVKPKDHGPQIRTASEIRPPRETRSRIAEQARLALARDPHELVDKLLAIQPLIDKFNRSVQPNPHAQVAIEVSRRARAAGRALTHAQVRDIRRKGVRGVPMEFSIPPIPDPRDLEHMPREITPESFYDELMKHIRTVMPWDQPCTSEVDLDTVEPVQLQPGDYMRLTGTCFGTMTGEVLIRTLPDPVPYDQTNSNVHYAEIYSWSQTQIEAGIPAGVKVKPGGQGAVIYVSTGDFGYTSNEIAVSLYPTYSLWFGEWLHQISGGWTGASENGVALDGVTLGEDWHVISCEVDAPASPRDPTAGGNSMAQGWHCGASAGRTVRFSLLYRVTGPDGYDPPDLGEVGWYLMSTGDRSWR